MDLIVLAAGRNERLKHIVPPYMKPVLVINGEPLIKTIVREALCNPVGHLVVVVAPENAAAIAYVLRPYLRNVDLIVQPDATGPLDAAFRALQLCQSELVTIVCADNVIPPATLREALCDDRPSISTSMITVSEAERFTRVKPNGRLIDGPYSEQEDRALTERCWIGPVTVHRQRFDAACRVAFDRDTGLTDALDRCGPFRTYVGNCADIGTPLALKENS